MPCPEIDKELNKGNTDLLVFACLTIFQRRGEDYTNFIIVDRKTSNVLLEAKAQQPNVAEKMLSVCKEILYPFI